MQAASFLFATGTRSLEFDQGFAAMEELASVFLLKSSRAAPPLTYLCRPA